MPLDKKRRKWHSLFVWATNIEEGALRCIFQDIILKGFGGVASEAFPKRRRGDRIDRRAFFLRARAKKAAACRQNVGGIR
ncbi:MAG: hypothetical protein FWE09_02005 [Treponema sp.]|nr:hypothetical protein [Treponema sp.]